MIPDYDVVVVDEAHEVVARVTQAATDELLASDVDRASRRSRRYVESGDAESSAADDLADAGDALGAAIAECQPGRLRRGAGDARPTPWCWCATPPAPASRRTPRRPTPQSPTPAAPRPAARCRRSSSPPSGWPPVPSRRALAERGRRPHPAAALRRAARGLGPDARQAAHRQDRGDDLGDPDARRRLQRDRHLGRAQTRRARARRSTDR